MHVIHVHNFKRNTYTPFSHGFIYLFINHDMHVLKGKLYCRGK